MQFCGWILQFRLLSQLRVHNSQFWLHVLYFRVYISSFWVTSEGIVHSKMKICNTQIFVSSKVEVQKRLCPPWKKIYLTLFLEIPNFKLVNLNCHKSDCFLFSQNCEFMTKFRLGNILQFLVFTICNVFLPLSHNTGLSVFPTITSLYLVIFNYFFHTIVSLVYISQYRVESITQFWVLTFEVKYCNSVFLHPFLQFQVYILQLWLNSHFFQNCTFISILTVYFIEM